MRTNVSTLLREFPKVRRAALSGETVIVETREGDLMITAAKPSGSRILGSMKNQIIGVIGDLTQPTSTDRDWIAPL